MAKHRTKHGSRSALIVSFLLVLLLRFETTDAGEDFSSHWAVEIDGGNDVAEEVASAHGFLNHGKIFLDENLYLFSHPKLKKRSLQVSRHHHANLLSHHKVKWAEQQRIVRRVKRDAFNPRDPPNDPQWPNMWYLNTSGNTPSMRIREAWQAGYRGKNVSVTILDDGIEHTHPDLQDNYDPLASGDLNDHDNDPTPRYSYNNENRHGTRCAGVVAASANNRICTIGIAYGANIGGVRMLDGEVTDAVEASAISFHRDHVDIYSSSWGPDDDGRAVDGPGLLAEMAFFKGATQGRSGKGSIFVWASGNGGSNQDNCNCDGYSNSIYTISISSTTANLLKPWYSETCSSILASTYSSGVSERQIVATDLRSRCTKYHTGTSASAPLAAGICALALEANPNITWRDMQHLIVQTSRPDGLIANDWTINGAKRKVSHIYGYGLMDAYGLVTKAREWISAPPQRKCIKSVLSEKKSPKRLSYTSITAIRVEVFDCDNNVDIVDRLEHVQAELTLRTGRRGQLTIYLISPSGTRSKILSKRRSDYSMTGFSKWSFMSTHFWDEDPRGIWKLEIHDNYRRYLSGTLSLYNLILYGTTRSQWSE